MSKFFSNAFETLGAMVRGTGKQVTKAGQTVKNDVVEQFGIVAKKADDDQAKREQIQAGAHNDEQLAKMQQFAEQRKIANYQRIQQEILALQHKRQQEIPAYITGAAGYNPNKIQQLEEDKNPALLDGGLEKKRKEEEEKKTPLPVKQRNKKAEMFRGASG